MKSILRDAKSVLPSYLFHLVVLAIGEVINIYPMRPGFWHDSSIQFLDKLGRWDSGYFIGIAMNGYPHDQFIQTAFFPLYPYTIRILSYILKVLPHGNPQLLAGIAISNIAFFIALFFIYRMALMKFNKRVAIRSILFISIFPTSFFFSAVYSESLFLCLVVTAFYAAYNQRWWISGTAIGLAALTRDTGAFVAISALIILYKFAKEEGTIFTTRNIFNALKLSVWPALIFSYYPVLLFVKYHHPFIFLVAENKYWSRSFHTPWFLLARDIHNLPFDFIIGSIFIVLLICSYKRLSLEQWIYFLIGLAIPFTSGNEGGTLSMARFVIVLFPAFIYLAAIMKNRSYEMVYTATGVVFMMLLTNMFGSSYWVA